MTNSPNNQTPVIPSKPIETKYRRITPPLPAPGSHAMLADSQKYEPRSMQGQPPIAWDRAEGFNVYDAAGNKWLDFSSGVLVANAGHSHPAIADAIVKQVKRGLLHNYCFPGELRITLARRLCELAPEPLKKAFLLSTGSEATECAVKLMRTHGRKIDTRKDVIVSFTNAFHGRTLGAQMIGGIPALKEWIGHLDPSMIQVPFPDGFRCTDISFEGFLRQLEQAGLSADRVAGVIAETYQGGGASFGPPAYFQQMRKWCDQHQILLTFDEVQAGFGRCGTMWGFEHYGTVPDLMCLGKGISSSLPVSAVVGRPDVMDLYPPGSMTSTHTGNPICMAAALANIDVILKEKLVENSARVGEVLHRELWKQLKPFDSRIGAIHGKGLVAGVHVIKDESQTPDPELAHDVVWHAVGRGLMLFAPVGVKGGTIKICPPLCITEEAVTEGVSVIAEAFAECLK
ncbi:MAG TPA: aspartate aminotransferase family protein [Phycisphaerae bacterium]|jgi:4-aminobutyrate aminotransferase/(S)-3-amino-2-methylpropionate transaminase|nr:aspartate aminotransferase family protein [Phycisphaerae bacterium]HOB73697.1 aspartate aminotransferase family protein [Phycisphaerae bacterium]HOJ53429.1 aspartate aminotransferase family protein [Phycisphaerae bacterium]HOL25447.1 aspartate aminotransferase family protein [Phycisphaerae bacterium]HPP19876.1 aspartate aminotransferase family protein [Phycisphaerae bacterium]